MVESTGTSEADMIGAGCADQDSNGWRLLGAGIWGGDTSLEVLGGQVMHFRLTNTNVVGAQITITSDRGGGAPGGMLILPGSTSDYPEFTTFGAEPMRWTFDVTTASDVFAVTWCLYSSWIPTVPTVDSLEPSTGIAGTAVTITGGGLSGVTSVNFGATEATITGADQTTGRLLVTAPQGQGTVDVTATTAAGTSSVADADKFTYL